jgi:hypothetical protein
LLPIQDKQLETDMRTSILAAVAACLIAMPATAGELRSTELSSQGVYIEGPGVGVRVGPDRRDRRHWREREVRRGGCKTVTVRETRPNGTIVTRTRSRC